MGYLRSSVKVPTPTKNEPNKHESKSKIEYFGADSVIAKLPDCGDCSYLIHHFSELGQASSNGFSMQPLLWSEVAAYAELNDLPKWEAVLIHAMSRMYVGSKYLFDDSLCECPYRYEDRPMIELQLMSANCRIKQEHARD